MWNPDKNIVSAKEVIGRRAFGDNNKIYTNAGQFRYNLFFDSRYEQDLSVDRLGIRQPNDEVLVFLTPKCEEHGRSLNNPFSGWAAMKIADLKELTVLATPDTENDNPYHADISRELYREKQQAETLAFRLTMAAYGLIEPKM